MEDNTMKKRKLAVVSLLLSIAMLLSACAGNPSSGEGSSKGFQNTAVIQSPAPLRSRNQSRQPKTRTGAKTGLPTPPSL